MNIARNICCDLRIPDATFPEEMEAEEFKTIGIPIVISTGR